MKKRVWVGLALAAVMAFSAGCSSSKVDYTISVSQYGEHPSLDATLEGFKAALKDAGLEDKKNIKIDYNSAQFEPSNSKTIAQKIANGKSDLALGIATNPALDLANTVTDRPVLFAAVTDPIEAGVVKQLQAPGGNVTGAADTNPDAIVQTMDFIAAEFPNVKTVGVIINEGEPNAVVMAKIAEEQLAKHGIKMTKKAIAKSAEVKQAADALVGKVDAIYITLDNEVVSGVSSIIEVANKNKIPFFSADRDSVEAGAFAAVGFKYYDHGYEVGQMAVEILKNGKKPGEMDVTVPQKLDFIINLKAAEAQGIEVTDKMKQYVKDQNNILQ
ncbi:ABC transporter substrate-binding protein [Paenibacillus sp. GXUN7292]|uniref:ABC transporter substrate-binding protein n=1 Tax=Paenibacillus sp. GXUN7292 TaxID=3422499 RepID=UPI003D7D093D